MKVRLILWRLRWPLGVAVTVAPLVVAFCLSMRVQGRPQQLSRDGQEALWRWLGLRHVDGSCRGRLLFYYEHSFSSLYLRVDLSAVEAARILSDCEAAGWSRFDGSDLSLLRTSEGLTKERTWWGLNAQGTARTVWWLELPAPARGERVVVLEVSGGMASLYVVQHTGFTELPTLVLDRLRTQDSDVTKPSFMPSQGGQWYEHYWP